jgi:hypothetical protein
MVDAADSKSATCEGVGVQVPSSVFIELLFVTPRNPESQQYSQLSSAGPHLITAQVHTHG